MSTNKYMVGYSRLFVGRPSTSSSSKSPTSSTINPILDSPASKKSESTLEEDHHHRCICSKIYCPSLYFGYWLARGVELSWQDGTRRVLDSRMFKVASGPLHSLAITLRSSNPFIPTMLHPQRDMIEEVERTTCVWIVLNLDTCWAIALEDVNNHFQFYRLILDVNDSFSSSMLPTNENMLCRIIPFLGFYSPQIALTFPNTLIRP